MLCVTCLCVMYRITGSFAVALVITDVEPVRYVLSIPWTETSLQNKPPITDHTEKGLSLSQVLKQKGDACKDVYLDTFCSFLPRLQSLQRFLAVRGLNCKEKKKLLSYYTRLLGTKNEKGIVNKDSFGC